MPTEPEEASAPSQVLFFDDDRTAVLQARSLGATAVWSPAGLTDALFRGNFEALYGS